MQIRKKHYCKSHANESETPKWYLFLFCISRPHCSFRFVEYIFLTTWGIEIEREGLCHSPVSGDPSGALAGADT
jgi:hypothetical protein